MLAGWLPFGIGRHGRLGAGVTGLELAEDVIMGISESAGVRSFQCSCVFVEIEAKALWEL